MEQDPNFNQGLAFITREWEVPSQIISPTLTKSGQGERNSHQRVQKEE